MLEIQAWQFSIVGAVLRSKSKDTIQISVEIKVSSYVVVGVRRMEFLSFPNTADAFQKNILWGTLTIG